MSKYPLLLCNQLCHFYQEKQTTTLVLQDINLSLQQSELVALLGKSGSGKSTLLHLLGGLQRPSSGEVFFQQQSLYKLSTSAIASIRNQSMGFVYQFHHLLTDFSSWENVAMPLLIAGVLLKDAKLQACDLLKRLGLEKRIDHKPSSLSGGERQRVAIARALINHPLLVLADEPTGALDHQNSQNLLELMMNLHVEYGTTFFVATHDLTLASQFNRQLYISDGRLIDGDVEKTLK